MEHFEITQSSRAVDGIFVGNPLSLSDTAIRFIESELHCLAFTRLPLVEDLFSITTVCTDTTRLIIVDETMVDDLVEALPKLRDIYPMASIALSYKKIDTARSLYWKLVSCPKLGDISFLPMNLNIDSWLSVIRLLASGERYVHAALLGVGPDETAMPSQESKVQAQPEKAASDDDMPLTAREVQVLKSAAEGKQNKIIAEELNLSQHTVKLHMHHIIVKLGVHNRTEAANWFHGRNFVV